MTTMITLPRKTVEQALLGMEAAQELAFNHGDASLEHGFTEAGNTLRTALEKPAEVEPVAWRWQIGGTRAYDYQSHDFAVLTHMPCGEPLYTSPPDAAAQIAYWERNANECNAERKRQVDRLEAACDSVCYARDQAYLEITRLEAQLRIAREALRQCRYRSLCDKIVDEALAEMEKKQ
jgi:hypothetical protein